MDPELRSQVGPIAEQVGAVVQTSQQMEMGICLSITLLKQLDSEVFTDSEFETEMNLFGKKTLGALIKEFKKHIDFDKQAEEALKLALKERNYIIHSFYNDQIESFLTPEGRKNALERVREARHRIHPGYTILDSAVNSLLALSGLSLAEITKQAESEIVK
jgi:hypothetical protein